MNVFTNGRFSQPRSHWDEQIVRDYTALYGAAPAPAEITLWRPEMIRDCRRNGAMQEWQDAVRGDLAAAGLL